MTGETRANPAQNAIETEPGSYHVLSVTVLRHRPREDDLPIKGEGFEFIARATRNPNDPQESDNWARIFDDVSEQQPVPLQAVDVPKNYWRSLDKTLQGKPGQVDEWTIALPDELIKAVRDKLKAEPATKAKP